MRAILGSVKYTAFHLNQVNGQIEVSVPLQEKVTAITQARYQGSQVGQRLRVVEALEIEAPGDVKVFAFVGYANSQIKGYSTQSSLYTDPTGGTFGAGVKTRKGVQVSGEAHGLGGEAPSQGSVKVNLPVLQKKKTKSRKRDREKP